MASTEGASGLMPHQKDEHDVWICKDCGWKYPNAKPSPKIRKHHKKQCPAKVGGTDHADDHAASDGEHSAVSGAHTPSPKPEENDAAHSEPLVETQDRSFDFASVLSKSEATEGAPPFVPANENGATKGVAEPLETLTKDATAEEQEKGKDVKNAPTALPETEKPHPSDSPSGGLMLHQKDEHDIWTCKKCGWKYPNAKPSPKVRKHHKKTCPGSGAHTHGAGGSSDEASDDDHHVSKHPPQDEPPSQVESTDRSFDIASVVSESAATESAAPFVDTTQSDGLNEGSKSLERLTEEATAVEQDENVSVKNAPAALPDADHSSAPTTPSGLMAHQKDEHDMWICKDCGWKYPNAKPSPKVRKHHKKACPGKGASKTTHGGSSDEASDDEHHGSSHPPLPVADAAGKKVDDSTANSATDTPAEGNLDQQAPITETPAEDHPVAEAPAQVSRDIDFAALAKQPAATAPVEEDKVTVNSPKTEGTAASEGQLSEGVGGLMPHQKDENDIWVCKHCGWKYPNAKPSAKVRSHHKKKCPGRKGGAKGGDSSGDEVPGGGMCFRCL